MSSKRLAVNTLVTYGRSVLSMGMALFSSRWVLQALGQSDFGLYSVVGSIIVFIMFVNGAMAGGAARFFAYAIGQGDHEEVRRWFNASLSLHVVLAASLVAVGWPLGEWYVKHQLVVPPGRLVACVWVFRVSLLSALVGMVSVPFSALFMAYQKLTELAVWGLLQSMLIFGMAYSLRHLSGDPLVVYAVGMVGIMVLIQCIQIVRAFQAIPACGLISSEWFSWVRLKQMTSFSSWTLIGSSGAVLRDQGSAMLLNSHYGPQVNAAYGIAMQVSAQTSQLAAALIGSFTPEITASEGRGDRVRMLNLARQVSKFGALLIMLFAIPLMIEMDLVLKLWLKTPPQYAADLCRFILGTFIVDRLTTGFMVAVGAKGQIAGYQLSVGGALLMVLPVAWIFLAVGMAPTSVGLAFLLVMTFTSLGRAWWMKQLFGQPLTQWLRDVVLGCTVVGLLALSGGLVPHLLLDVSLLRLGLVVFCALIGFCVGLNVVLSVDEKRVLRGGVMKIYAKISN